MATTWDLLVEGDALIESAKVRKQNGTLERVSAKAVESLDPK